MSFRPHLLMAFTAALAVAGAANAQVATRPLDLRLPDLDASVPAAALVGTGFETTRPTPDLANPLDPHAPTTLATNPLDTAVFAKTSIEHHFAQRDDLKGSLGFLCGLQPGHADSGAGSAYGVDPHGRFVGAKFSIAFQ